jgi:hypothetical protein
MMRYVLPMILAWATVAKADDAFKCPPPTTADATCNDDNVCCTKWVIDLKDGGRGMGILVGKTPGEAAKKLEEAKAFEHKWCGWLNQSYPCGAFSRALEAADEPHCPNALNTANAPRDPGEQTFDNETRAAIDEAKRLIKRPFDEVESRIKDDAAGTSKIAVGKTFGEYADAIQDAVQRVNKLQRDLEDFQQCTWRNTQEGLNGAIDDIQNDIAAAKRANSAADAAYAKLPIADKIKAPLPEASSSYEEIQPLPDGGALVKIRGRWGRVDKKGALLIKPIYDALEAPSGGRSKGAINGVSGVVDARGSFVADPSQDAEPGGIGGLPSGKWWQRGHDACPAGTLLRGVPPVSERGSGRYSCSLNEVCGVTEFPELGGGYLVECLGFTDYRRKGGVGTSVTKEADTFGRYDTGIGNNVAHGPLQTFYPSGMLACSAMLDHGKVVAVRCLDESGKVATKPQPGSENVWISGKAAVPTEAEKKEAARQRALAIAAGKKAKEELQRELARRKEKVKEIEPCHGTDDGKWHWYSCKSDVSPYPFTPGCQDSMKVAKNACEQRCKASCSTHQGTGMPAL